MAKLARLVTFLKVFTVALLAGAPGRGLAADETEIAAWQQAAQQNTIAAYYRYLVLYPTGAYIDQALEALRRLGAISEASPGRQIPPLAGPRMSTGFGLPSSDRDDDRGNGVYE